MSLERRQAFLLDLKLSLNKELYEKKVISFSVFQKMENKLLKKKASLLREGEDIG